MTEETVEKLTLEVLSETPGKAAKINLVFRQGTVWMVLLGEGEEELALRINENEIDGEESAKRILADQVRMLF